MKCLNVIIILLVFTTSCNKGKSRCGDAGSRSGIELRYVDSLGRNLFSNNIKCLSLANISIYDLQNNMQLVPITYYDSISNVIDFSTASFIKNYSRSLIHLKTGINDTIVCHYSGVANEVCSSIDSVWYNGVLYTAKNNKPIVINRSSICN